MTSAAAGDLDWEAFQAANPRPDTPLTPVQPPPIFSTEPGPYGVAWAGRGTRNSGGNATLVLNIPGSVVGAYFYLSGKDDPSGPGPHYPDGDAAVRVEITNGAGATRVLSNIPVVYTSGMHSANRREIARYLSQGTNTIKVSGYDVNLPEGAFAYAVYNGGDATPVKLVQALDGMDIGYYPYEDSYGPDTELASFVFDPSAAERTGRVLLAIAGAEAGRGDEIFGFTGTGAPTDLPDTDGDGKPDIVNRRVALTRVDNPPLGVDPANAAGALEAHRLAISLEEDCLGVLRSSGGCGVGPEFNVLTKPYTIGVGRAFSSFQVQSEDPENGDSFTMLVALNELPLEGINPLPEIEVIKDVTPGQMPEPGGVAAFQITVNNLGAERLNVTSLVDDVFGNLNGKGTCTLPRVLVVGGTYRCSFTAPVSGTVESPHHDTVTVNGTGQISGEPVTDSDDATVTFTRPQTASIGDRVWLDADRDGDQDPGETGIDGVTVILKDAGANIVGTTTTATSGGVVGYYLFTNLAAGAYTVEVTQPAGMTQTYDLDGLGTPNAAARAVAQGEAATDVDFGYAWSPGRIVVVKQTVPDGAQGVFAFTANYDADGFSLSDGQSDTSADLPPGNAYSVSEAPLTGWVLDSSTCDDGSLPSAISLQPGETVTCTFVNRRLEPDFTLTKTASIAEGYPGDLVTYVFVVENTGAVTLVNLTVTDDKLGDIGTVTLAPGDSATLTKADYPLPFCSPGGFTSQDLCNGSAGTADRCSLPNTATAAWGGLTRQARDCVDILPFGKIGDRAWHDLNRNGLQDPGEPGLPGVVMTLSGVDPAVTDTTDPSGLYLFTDLKAGSYSVASAEVPGFVRTTPATHAVTLGIGQTYLLADFGYAWSPGRIVVVKQTVPDGAQGVFAFTANYDADGFSLSDGQSDTSADLPPGNAYSVSEAPLTGWVLDSSTCDDGSLPSAISLQPGETVTCTFVNRRLEPDFTLTKTASIAEGYPGDLVTYVFVVENTGAITLENLTVTDDKLGDIGTVTLAPGDSATLTKADYPLPFCSPGGFTSQDLCNGSAGTADHCSLPNTATAAWGGLTRQASDCVDILPFGKIGDRAWHDLNRNGLQDPGEPGLPGVVMTLSGVAPAVTDTTDPSGLYLFTDLKTGSYSVASAAVTGFVRTTPATHAVTLGIGQTYLFADFGYWKPLPDIRLVKTAAPLEVYPGDPVTYTYVVTNTGNAVLVDIVVTDNKLGYIGTIDRLEPDEDATLTKTVPAPACGDGTSTIPCAQEVPSNPLAIGSAPLCHSLEPCYLRNTATARGYEEIFRTEVSDDDDACIKILPFGAIGDYVWEDKDRDREQEAGEPGIQGVTVVLFKDGVEVATAVTDQAGGYLFGGLKAGDYVVDSGGKDGYALTTANDPLPVSLGISQIFLEADFGYWRPLPRINVTKLADPTFGYLFAADPSTPWPYQLVPTPLEVAYSVGVTNPGQEPLENVSVTDDPAALVFVYQSGDANGDGKLDLTETWVYTGYWTYTTPGVYPDTVTARGTGVTSGRDVTATADASVEAVGCGQCLGKVSRLTLRYNGTFAATIKVVAENAKFPDPVAFVGTVQPGGIFSFGPLASGQEGFDGTLGTNISVLINGQFSVSIHTSCSQPIYPGLDQDPINRQFTVMSGASKQGGLLCPVLAE